MSKICKINFMKVLEVIKLIKENGWFEIIQKVSHKQFKHNNKCRVTIYYHKK